MDELRIWALRDGTEVRAIESVSGIQLENTLEDVLVHRPEMLEADLHIVGRQTPTEGGPLDLLGVDAGGRLVVFELKRERLTREAVTQCIDYAAALNAMTLEELATFIAEQSGWSGGERIADFQEWYEERFSENELGDLLPPRLALVGLGIDERAERMARFLSEGGVDISVLTFFGFQHGEETLLARQMEVERRGTAPSGRRHGTQSAAERHQALQALLAESGLAHLFHDIAGALRDALPGSSERIGSSGISFSLPSGGGRRRFCHLWAWGTAIQVEWFPRTEHDGAPELEELEQKAGQRGWHFKTSSYALDIDSDEQWQAVREGLVRFIEGARKAWTPAPPSEAGDFRERVWAYVNGVPRGTVVTYGQVAVGVGSPDGAQAVGNALHALPDETDVPWHRVVPAQGRLAETDRPEQRSRLEDEGVTIGGDGSINLEEHRWRG